MTTTATGDNSTDQPQDRFTLRIDFSAPDPSRAQLIAASLAEGLGRLRSDVDMCSAQLSPAGALTEPQPVFCGAVGPDGERCADEPDHGDAWHTEGGVNGRTWADNEPSVIRLR